MRTAAALLLLILMPALSFAVDFGLTIDNTTRVTTNPNNVFYQYDKATLWMTVDLAENIFFNIEGFYRINIVDPYHAYSLDLFELKADFPVIGEHSFLFGFSLGRFFAEDFTGYVLAHPLDGARLVYRNAFMNASLSGGFTGLIFKGESTLAMSYEDVNYSPSPLPLVPPRLIGMLGVDFPELFAYQTLYLSVIGQLDMHDDSTVIQEGTPSPVLDSGGKIDTLYAGIGLTGPLFDHFFWELFLYFEYGRTLSDFNLAYQYVPIYSFLTGVSFDWFFPEFKQSKLSLNVLLASGDGDYDNYLEGNTDAYSLQFIPITRPTIGVVFAQQLTNIIIVRLEYSLKPFLGDKPDLGDKFETALSVITFFRSARSDVSDSRGLNSGSDQYYLGNEIDLIATFRPVSDLGLELTLGLFLPNNYTADSAFSPDGRDIEFLARFQFSFNL